MNIKNFTLKSIAAMAFILASSYTNAQVKVGANPTTIGTNNNLEVEATNAKKVAVKSDTGQLVVGSTATTIPTGGTNAAVIIDNGTTNGAIQIKDGTQGAEKVLVSDANGVATWKTNISPSYFIKMIAEVPSDVTLPFQVASSIPGWSTITAPATGKYLIAYHSFLYNPTANTSGEKSFYFETHVNGILVGNDETYSSVVTLFNQHYSTIIHVNQGDLITFRIRPVIGCPNGLVLTNGLEGRNILEFVFLGS